jgi:enterochelin esterase-like enzyme
VFAKRTATLTILLFVYSCFTCEAAENELVVGKTQDASLVAGKAQSYALPLKAGDFVELKLDPHGTEVVVLTYGPAGAKVRGAKLGPEQDTFDFIAEAAGQYRLEIALDESDNAKQGTCAVTLIKSVSLADRLAPPAAKLESPRIKALREALDAGQPGSVATFWDERKSQGTPLIERLDGDDRNMLVTFLWKGTPDTQNAMILWFPFTVQWPDDYKLQRLANTDVWYKTLKVNRTKRFIYRIAVNAPALHPSQEPAGGDTFSTIWAGSQVDPLNQNHWSVDPSDPDVPEHQGFSAVSMPDAPVQPWVAVRKGVRQGKIERHQFASALLKNEREIGVYLPPGYATVAGPYPLLVLFDENAYLKNDKAAVRVPTETILDNLIAENRIPPMVAIFVDNGPGDARSRELPCNATFADFLNFELVPWVRRLYNVTTNPREVVIGGSSYGGLAATWAGLRHPETFGNVLSQSGSYWWTPPKSSNPSDFDNDAEPNWMAKQFIAAPKLPLRFYMDAGSDEIDLSGKGSSILVPNRHLRDVLLAKGYEVHYQEFVGGHDYLSWRGTLADGLILLMGSSSGGSVHEALTRETAPKP